MEFLAIIAFVILMVGGASSSRTPKRARTSGASSSRGAAPRRGRGSGRTQYQDFHNPDIGSSSPSSPPRVEPTDPWLTRPVCCERQVDSSSIGVDHPIIRRLVSYGLQSFFEPIEFYVPELVRHFYRYATFVSAGEGSLHSVFRGSGITITPGRIGRYLGCTRPSRPQFPHAAGKGPASDFLIHELYVHPSDYRTQFVQGSLHEEYRLLNMIVRWNLVPLGHRLHFHDDRAQLLFALKSGKSIDFPVLIFDTMRKVALSTNRSSALPFGVMITRMCLDDSMHVAVSDSRIPPVPGAITSMSLSRSTATSTPDPDAPGSTTARPPARRQASLDSLSAQLRRVFDSITSLTTHQIQMNEVQVQLHERLQRIERHMQIPTPSDPPVVRHPLVPPEVEEESGSEESGSSADEADEAAA